MTHGSSSFTVTTADRALKKGHGDRKESVECMRKERVAEENDKHTVHY
jgi:hypothetical protein